MIEYIEGDIFESPAQVIVNTVNTVGVMGKGLALAFKQRYPKMFEIYKNACEKGLLSVGKLMLFYEADHWLLMFPTKESWRNPSKLEYIEKGLMKFVSTYADKSITSVAFPRLGCGNGEMSWNDVKPLMERYLKKLPIDVYIYLGTNPDVIPEHKEPQKTIAWLREHAKDMSFVGVKDDLRSLSAVLPYRFSYESAEYDMTFGDALVISDTAGKRKYEIGEEKIYSIWDDIRNRSVFSCEAAPDDINILYALLYEVGYLSKIKIQSAGGDKMVDGYQVNAGLGRVMALMEE